MNKFSLIAIIALALSWTAQAAEPVAVPSKPVSAPAVAVPTKPAPVPASATPVKPISTTAAVTPQKTSTHSQQDKMRECNKQATGKKGDERRSFMKTCLSKKV